MISRDEDTLFYDRDDCDEPRRRRPYRCTDGMCGGCERCVPGIDEPDDDGGEE